MSVRLMQRYAILLPLVLVTAASAVTAQATIASEDGKVRVAQSAAAPFVEGTNIDVALAPHLGSSALVPVIVFLENQPILSVASKVQSAYLPRIREKNLQVRAILAKYAGSRNFHSEQEMEEQARREAEAVTPADRARKKELNREADALLDEMRKEITQRVSSKTAADQAQLAAAVAAIGGIVTYRFDVESAIAARVPGTAIEALSHNPLISHIDLDALGHMHLNVSAPTVSANSFWSVGFDGGIYDAGICDTGVDVSHPALDDDTVAARTWYSGVFNNTAKTQAGYNDNSTSTDDLQGHGSHVAGIVLSSNATYRGIGFGGDVALNIKSGFRGTDGGGHLYASDTYAGMDWSSTQPEEPEVINYSAGWEVTVDDDDVARFFDAYTEAKACTTSVSAGNSGPTATTVGSPGIGYNTICVANMDDRNTTNRSDDVIRGSSSRGPTQNGRKKPDITAPGTDIMSCNNNWETENDFVSKTGTSMAAPHITGATLLLNDAGIVDPREVKAVLINTADDWGDPGWDAAYGWGYLNLARAYLHRNDVFLYSVTPNGQPGSYRLFKTTGMDAGETATMTWYRHAVYNGANAPTTYYGLNDLNLRLYDEATNASISSDLTSIDNVHQVTSDRSGTQVIRAYAWSSSFTGGRSTETFALATQEGTTLAANPTVTPSAGSYTPPLNAKFYVSVQVSNTGDVAAHSCSVTLTLPSGVILAEGSLSQSLGTIASGSYKYASFRLKATSAGAKTVAINTSSSSYGLGFTGSGSFAITPGAQDTVAPHSTMSISDPIYRTGGTEKVANGGFESGTAGWATSGLAAIDTTAPRTGTNCLKLGTGSGSAYQTVSVGSGAASAFLTFWYRSSAGFLRSAGCSIQDSAGNTLVYPFYTSAVVGNWTEVSVDLCHFKGQTIRVNFYSVSGFFGDSTIWVDDISLKENQTVWIDGTSPLSISASDDNSGVDYSEYGLLGDPWTTYTGSFTLAGAPEGSASLYYRSVDNGGNYEPQTPTHMSIDNEPPKSVLFVNRPTAVIGGTEKALNGGFESGLADWTITGAAVAVSSPTHSGSRAVRVGGTGEGSVSQDIAVSSRASRAFLTFWTRSVQGTSPYYVAVYVIDAATGYSCYAVGWNYTGDWSQWTFDVTRFRGAAVRVQFNVYGSSGAPAILYVDDVSLRENCSAYVTSGVACHVFSADACGEQSYEYNLDSAGYTTGQDFSVTGAGTHSVLYRATDYLGHVEPSVATQLIVDSTGPTGSIAINGGADFATSTAVTLTLSASDAAGVTEMRIQSDTGVWGPWQAYQTTLPYTLATSTEGVKTLGVQFRDGVSNESAVYTDSINLRTPVSMDIPHAKMLANGDGVRLGKKVVTAVFPNSGYFYVEEPDRTSGIRVRSNTLPSGTNILVSVDGVTDIVYAECEIVATSVTTGAAVPEIKPLGLTNRSLGGGGYYSQPGVPGVDGLNNVGLLVQTTGRVVEQWTGRFYIDDGSPVADSRTFPCVLIDNQMLGGWMAPLGSYVSVTGISGMETISGSPVRSLRPRGIYDVKIRQLHAAFIYDTAASDADSFRQLLNSEGVLTNAIPLSKLGGASLSGYDVILIANDTGLWSDPALVGKVLSVGAPVIGVGEGGARFFDAVTTPDLYIGWLHAWSATASQGSVVGGECYAYPHDLGVAPGSTIPVYTSGVMAESVYDPTSVTTQILREYGDPDHYVVAGEAGRFYLWGFEASPASMTNAGRDLFVNLVYRSLLP